jgi:hypothetical protein
MVETKADEIDDITRALTQFRASAAGYLLYQEYYDGAHRLAFATDKFKSAFGRLFKAFADNLCPAVVDAVADKLLLTGFAGDTADSKIAPKDAWAIWKQNRMDQRAGQVHVEALRSGDSYVIVWPDAAGTPTIYPNAGASMMVHYDAETPGLVLWAAKQWKLDDGTERLRLNMYYPDRIEKWVTKSKAHALPEKSISFVEYEVENEPWPVPNEWGVVPVFHFANNSGLEDLGNSELGNVIPLQDALNKTIADMLVAMEFVALPQRWITGLDVILDETTGKPITPFTPGADRVWAVGATDAQFGQFDPANLEQFTRVQNDFRAEIARVSGTPLHYLMLQSGEFPSGESMKTAEERFTAKVRDRQVSFGNTWENAMALALRMAGKAEAQLSAEWKDPTPRSERDQINMALIKKDLGVPRARILAELGYGAEEIPTLLAEWRAEKTQLGDALLQNWEDTGGQAPGVTRSE